MTKPKRKRTDLNVPQFVIDKWNSGTNAKDEMAELLLHLNNNKDKFIEELELIIKKIKKFTLHVDEGWYSELEMKTELKWSPQRIAGAKKLCEANPDLVRSNVYDGVKEYYVTVRETAKHVHAHEQEQSQRKKMKAEEPMEFKKDEFDLLDKAKARSGVPDRGSISQIEDHIKKLDSEYEKVNELKSKGEVDGYDPRNAKKFFGKNADDAPFPWPDPSCVDEAERAKACATLPTARVVPSPPKLSAAWKPAWERHVSDSVLADNEIVSVLREVDEHSDIEWRLAARATTAGGILSHAIHIVNQLLHRHAPMIFKIGFTHNACWRWENTIYGYRWQREKWEKMCLLHIAEEPFSLAMLEAALINKFQSTPGCRNTRSGGDNVRYFCIMSFLLCKLKLYCIPTNDKHKSVLGLAEASCSSAVESARAVVEEMPAAATASVRRVAKCSVRDAERDMHRLGDKFRLRLGVRLSRVPLLQEMKIAILFMSSWINLFLQKNLWYFLCGLDEANEERCERQLELYWERFRGIAPQHPVFQRSPSDLRRTCPVLVHGDEGRSAKKTALMVLSFHAVLGRGSSQSSEKGPTCAEFLPQEMNFLGHTFATRYLLAVLPRAMYDDALAGNFQRLLGHLVPDMRSLFEEGLLSPVYNKKFFVCVVNIMGDWPFLAKAFNYNRTFGNSAKRESSKKAPTGICHACLADRPGFPFEDFESSQPRWRQTVNVLPAYDRTPVLMTLPHDAADPSGFAGQDYFHGFHLGAGKIFVASVLALLQYTFAGDSFKVRFKSMESAFFDWCQRHRQFPYIRKLNQDTLVWPHATEPAMGGWSKGSTTLCLLRWFVCFCHQSRDTIPEDSLLFLAWQAAWQINKFFSMLYREKLWIIASRAKEIAAHGRAFLKYNGRCAKRAFDENLMEDQAEVSAFVQNGLMWKGDACQCPAIMFNAQAWAHKVNELSNDFNRILWCLTGFNTTYVIDLFMAQGHTSHVLAHGLQAHLARWQLGGFEMQAHLSQNAADSLRTFGSVVHTTSEQCTQTQAQNSQQSLVITGRAPRTAEEASCLQLLCPRDADLVVLDPDYQVLMQEELLLLERLCHPRIYAVNNVNLAAHGGWIKEYLLNLDFVEVARGSSPDFNAQANADAGKGKLSREFKLLPFFGGGGELELLSAAVSSNPKYYAQPSLDNPDSLPLASLGYLT
ncbi:unnamed protein product [Symbiodinium sp. CCMP2592]|nr:unnamed protein product [Symbiodinium sp. CCMP2592]